MQFKKLKEKKANKKNEYQGIIWGICGESRKKYMWVPLQGSQESTHWIITRNLIPWDKSRNLKYDIFIYIIQGSHTKFNGDPCMNLRLGCNILK